MILDHVGLVVSDYEKSKAFYTALLNPLGIKLLTKESGFAGFGIKDTPIASFWIHEGDKPTSQTHIAFLANSKEQVHLFHEAGLKINGKDNGKPDYRKHYHPNYYAAFITDLDGHNIEAVCYVA